VSFRRDRFADLVARQLEVFVEDEQALLREAEAAETNYDAADREDAEEAFGDYQLVLESIADELEGLRDGYAATLEPDVADAYAQAFARAVRNRFPKLRAEL